MEKPGILLFETIYKEKIWGGEKINSVLKKDFSPLLNCGETWELSGVKGDISSVKNGSDKGKSLVEVINLYREQLMGKSVYKSYGNSFPLLVKFIDAAQDLSIQVHPNDDLAKKRHDSFGKTEMWYVIHADPGSSLISGFNQPLDKAIYLEKFNAGELESVLNREEVHSGDVFFVPAGRVHTIGKGLLIAEIQQTSDITYRIYDFDRVDEKGNKRELHVEEALDAFDFKHYDEYKSPYSLKMNEVSALVESEYFTTNLIPCKGSMEREYNNLDSFVIYTVVEGSLTISTEDSEGLDLQLGDVALIPSWMDSLLIQSSGCKVLETYIKKP